MRRARVMALLGVMALAVMALAVMALGVMACGGAPSGPAASVGSGSRSGSHSPSADETLRRINLEAICQAEVRSGAVVVAGASERRARIASWLRRQLAHDELRAFALEELPGMTDGERAAALHRLADQGGLERCPLAELWAWWAEDEAERPDCRRACEERLRATTVEGRAECELGCREEDVAAPDHEDF